jgi:hypothetical protein
LPDGDRLLNLAQVETPWPVIPAVFIDHSADSGREAVDGERGQRAGLEVVDEPPDRHVGRQSGDGRAEEDLSVDVSPDRSGITPIGFAHLATTTPKERLGQTLGSAEVGRDLGDAGGPLLVGAVAAATTLNPALLIFAALLIATAARRRGTHHPATRSIQPMRIRTLDELQTEPNATPKSSLTWYAGTEFMLVV